VYEIDGPARLKGRDSEFASAFSFIACWRSRTPLISLTQTPVRNPFRLTPNSRGDQMYGPTLTRRLRLDLEHLEPRDTPAGTVNAVLSGTTLTLIGDDADNAVQLNKTPGGIEVVGINATQVTGGVQPFAGVIAIRAVMKDGNDTVFLDPAADLVLSGISTFDLGDGDNVLQLSTTGKLDLGGLTVLAGDGLDKVTIAGGP